MTKPRVVILGRPNVGKSSLFNRIIERRRAITDEMSGVTRDAVEATTKIAGRAVTVVDTGGVTDADGVFDAAVRGTSLEAARDAAVILLVLDVTTVTPEDEELIETIRPYRDRTVLVVNKVDTPDRDSLVWEQYAHGFDEVVPVSAAHGRGMDVLIDSIVRRLPAVPEPAELVVSAPSDEATESAVPAGSVDGEGTLSRPIRIAILGRPNTGKSTLANYLVGRNASLVSDIPGTTRDVVENEFVFRGRTFTILDTAGIRKKSRVTEAVEYYSVNRAIKTIDEADIVYLMIDATIGLEDQDKKIAAHAVRKGRGIVIVLNKWDLAPDTTNAFTAFSDRIRYVFPVLGFAPILPVTATTGEGVPKLLTLTEAIFRRLTTRIETGRLNAALARWVEATPPPTRGPFRWKPRYMTQVSSNPTRFVLFANSARNFPTAYQGYIVNSLRREFGLSDIPIELDVRDGAKK